jgi:hypothetical protein
MKNLLSIFAEKEKAVSFSVSFNHFGFIHRQWVERKLENNLSSLLFPDFRFSGKNVDL